jgi:hypothetical protein
MSAEMDASSPSSTSSSSLVQALKHDGITLEIRTADGFVNATKMSKSAGKEWSNYVRKTTTQDFLRELGNTIHRAPKAP